MESERGTVHRRLAWSLWIATVIISVVSTALTVVAWRDLDPADATGNFVGPLPWVLYATLGLLILRRVHNAIGWLLLLEGVAGAVMYLTSFYALVGVLTTPDSLPAPKVVGTLSQWMFVPVVMILVFVLLLFPTGTLPSRRWRPLAALGLGLTGLAMIGFLVSASVVALPAPGGVSLQYPNPLALDSLGHGAGKLLLGDFGTLTVLSAGFLVMALVALVVRFRAGAPEVRQQIKWVAFMAGLFIAAQVALLLAHTACGCWEESAGTIVAGLVVAVVALFGLPIAITIAILKYGLYEIDVIINRAVVYGLLAAAFTVVYVVIVAGIGSLAGYAGGPVLSIFAAAAIALLFQPLRRRSQRIANRIVYGERATPYQVLSEFAEHMAGTIGLDETLERMVAVLAAGTGATEVEVRILVGSELRAVVVWPERSTPKPPLPMDGDDLPHFPEMTRAVPVRQRDELLGSIALRKPPNEPLTLAEDKLLQDLAAQAGLVLRNVRLTAELEANIDELRASRRRLVEAQDAERRRLERNIHDGAQQQLVALAVQLGLLERVASDPGRVAETAQRLRTAVQETLDDLRDLARGIYPPLLADQGLAVALRSQARKATVPTTVESDGIGRYPQETEATVYFCSLEALQNVAKYAGATAVAIRLAEADGELRFEIEDDGRGFSVDGHAAGSGLQGMADRLAAVGGSLEVTSEPGRGTLVRGRIPVPAGANPARA